MSAARKGRAHTSEHAARIAEANKGKVRSLEVKTRLSELTKVQMSSPDVRAKLSALARQQMAQPGIRERLRKQAREQWKSEGFRVQMQARDRSWMKTLEYRNKISAIAIAVYASNPALREMRAIVQAKRREQWPRLKTSLEYALAEYLGDVGLAFEEQRRFGRYIVDAYVPWLNVAFEADGSYWHKDKKKEAKRNAYLLARGLGAVIHLGETQLAGFFTKGR